VPYLADVRSSLAAGYVPGGSRRSLDWVRPSLEASVGEEELQLLADAQTSGGLLVAGELPGHPVVGRLVEHRRGEPRIRVV
jgi:selenide,water dikinase